MFLNSFYKIKIDPLLSNNSYLYNKEDNRLYLDFMSMYSSLPLGYNHDIFKRDDFKESINKWAGIRITNCEYTSEEREIFEKDFIEFIVNKNNIDNLKNTYIEFTDDFNKLFRIPFSFLIYSNTSNVSDFNRNNEIYSFIDFHHDYFFNHKLLIVIMVYNTLNVCLTSNDIKERARLKKQKQREDLKARYGNEEYNKRHAKEIAEYRKQKNK